MRITVRTSVEVRCVRRARIEERKQVKRRDMKSKLERVEIRVTGCIAFIRAQEGLNEVGVNWKLYCEYNTKMFLHVSFFQNLSKLSQIVALIL